MGTILDHIIETKRQEVANARRLTTDAEMIERAREAPPPRDFHAAILAPAPHGIHLIAEIKKASPSAGLIRADFDPVTIARAYHRAGASALSVVTDREYFQGELPYIEAAKSAVPLPVLRKDFTIDPYQIYEARVAGADAILLIAEVLATDQVIELTALADDVGMTTLVEAHSPNLLLAVHDALLRLKPDRLLLGINNRDLSRQVVELETTERLAGLLQDTSNLVAESGIRSRDDVRKVQAAGAAAMLVGETLMAADDIRAKAFAILGRS